MNPHPGQSQAEQWHSFTRAVGAVPAVLSLYTPWNAPAPVSDMQAVVAQGAVPLVSWGCGPVAGIIAGQSDDLITAYADALKAFERPVFLRWFWEMNLKTPVALNCLGSDGPEGFIAAWKHIWTIFQQAGATNVAFVWCPGVSSGLARMAPYFPGSAYVDWIGADGYDTMGLGRSGFGGIFGAWYAAYAGYGKPLMIAETGAGPRDQVAYLDGIASAVPTRFPDVRALVYFDAPGRLGAWELTPYGLEAFGRLAEDPYFSPGE